MLRSPTSILCGPSVRWMIPVSRTLVDRAGIVNHRRAVDRDPSRIVDVDPEFVVAGLRRDIDRATCRTTETASRPSAAIYRNPVADRRARCAAALAALVANIIPAQQSVMTALQERLHDSSDSSRAGRPPRYPAAVAICVRRRDAPLAPQAERFRQIERADNPEHRQRPQLERARQSAIACRG